jgi:hypothetical protein
MCGVELDRTEVGTNLVVIRSILDIAYTVRLKFDFWERGEFHAITLLAATDHRHLSIDLVTGYDIFHTWE